MTTIERDQDYVFWQNGDDTDCNIPEPAIAIKTYDDVICLTQGENSINLNYASLKDFAKMLAGLKKPEAEK